jgi:L-fuconolactonase
VNAFGTKRIMFGSDWPVCLVAATYKEMLHVVEDYFNSFSETEQEDLFGKNAQHFYQLK